MKRAVIWDNTENPPLQVAEIIFEEGMEFARIITDNKRLHDFLMKGAYHPVEKRKVYPVDKGLFIDALPFAYKNYVSAEIVEV